MSTKSLDKIIKVSSVLIAVLIVILLINLNKHSEQRDCPEQLIKPNVNLENQEISSLNSSELSELLEKTKKEKDNPPQNAYLKPNSQELIPEKPGHNIDIEETKNKLLSATRGAQVKLSTQEIQAQITSEFITTKQKQWLSIDHQNNNRQLIKVSFLSTYTTPINNDQAERITNIEIALNELNGLIIKEGKEFSFNKQLGEPNAEKGYQKAPVYISGQFEADYGGGICQVSSTLYNTLLAASLKITERHPHSFKVNYVPPNKDATIVYEFKDLKFINNKESPIIVLGEIIEQNVVIFLLRIHEIR